MGCVTLLILLYNLVTVLSFPSPEPESDARQEINETAPTPKAINVSDDEAASAREDDEIDEVDADLLAVTHPRWQDKVLRKYGFYADLPDIPCVATPVTFFSLSNGYVVRTLYTFRPYDRSSSLFDEFTSVEGLGHSFDVNVIQCVLHY